LSDYHDLIAGNVVYPALYDKVGIDFRLSYIEKAARKTVDPVIREELIRLTGGHAKLIKLSYEAVISGEASIENLEEILLKRSTVQGGLHELWNALLPSEQLALKKESDYQKIGEEFPYLALSGLINETGITIPLFTSYIKSVPIDATEKITYDSEKNEIIMGTTPLADKLSPSEFKLMRFLIQNKERLCSKDEIIQAVWGDQKSYEGVTDQALDQIFYRLRKKIEQDPQNPHYIHTIKGKGYKLSD
jgi:hypothetical protein